MSAAQYGSVRITPTFGGENVTLAAPLQTEPTRTLRWKCARQRMGMDREGLTDLNMDRF